MTYLRNYFIDTLPEKLVCCRLSREQCGIRKAIEQLEQEIDFVELIKSQRFVKKALRKLLTRHDRMQLKKNCRYRCIDPDSIPSHHEVQKVQLRKQEKFRLKRSLTYQDETSKSRLHKDLAN